MKSINSLYVYSHLGLGDMIVCNGLIRYYSKIYDIIYVFCKSNNKNNIQKMYRDNDKIQLIIMNDNEVINFLNSSPWINVKIIGHTKEFFKQLSFTYFDDLFYTMNNLDINIKWDNFYYERDRESELQAYKDIYDIKENEEYIIVHQSDDRKVYKNIRIDLRIIEPNNMNVTLFDHLLLIEKAKEVHLMNSSLLNLINCSKIRTDGLFYHRYARPNIDPHLTNNWIIYE